MDQETEKTITAFWFGTQTDDKAVADAKSRLWWAKDAAADKEIAGRFEAYVQKAAIGELDAWRATATGRLALILLTDQFPRNIYRGNARAFSFDPLALAWSKDGVREGLHLRLRPIERVFFYLPLEHAESRADQEQSVALFQALVTDALPEHKSTFDGFLRFAILHRDIIQRFGRFPHRNKILGRESTAEETDFLKEKGAAF